jgi:O-antigen ligase
MPVPTPRAGSKALGDGWVLAVPAVVGGILAFRAGGFFADSTGLAAVAVAVLLVLRVTLARAPFAGMSRVLAVAIAGLAGFAVWTLLSALWSHAAGRAVVEFDRALLYLLVVVLAGSVARRPGALATTIRLTAAAIGVVCLAALASRLAPGVFPTHPGLPNGRLSFPLTYWNALGVLSAIGVTLAVHLGSSPAERPAVRIAAAAALPVLACTLYLTLSRGGIAAAVVGVVAYAVLARPPGLLPLLLAAGPAVAAAVVRAYDAAVLVRPGFAGARGVAEGRSVAFVVVLCVAGAALLRWLALGLDVRLGRLRVSRRALAGAAAVVVLVASGAAAAADAPARLGRAWDEFAQPQQVVTHGDPRRRLTALGNNGRIPGWRVAWRAFERAPAHGSGAGTFALDWERERPAPPLKIVDAHSLYVEVLAELGVPGLLLLGTALAALLAGGIRALRGPERHAAAAFLAAGGALLLHAGVDWDWEMPAVMTWLFGTGAVAAAAAPRTEHAPGRLPRVLAGLGLLLLALTPAATAASQRSLDRAAGALAVGACPRAVDAALAGAHRLPVRAEPFEILGFCDIRGGRTDLAEQAMLAARRRDPRNWEYAYGLAVARGAAGHDPRPAARAALDEDPLGTDARDLAAKLRGARTPAAWRRVALTAPIPSE